MSVVTHGAPSLRERPREKAAVKGCRERRAVCDARTRKRRRADLRGLLGLGFRAVRVRAVSAVAVGPGQMPGCLPAC